MRGVERVRDGVPSSWDRRHLAPVTHGSGVKAADARPAQQVMPCLQVWKVAWSALQRDLESSPLFSDLPEESVSSDVLVAGVPEGDRAGVGDLVTRERSAVIRHDIDDRRP